MTWKEYKDLEPIRRLRYKGRELIGHEVDITIKRDGENVSLWQDVVTNEIFIASHGLEIADQSIQTRMKLVPEYNKVRKLIDDRCGTIIPYGELLKTTSPTRVERTKKHTHWILFDIFDKTLNEYLDYGDIVDLSKLYKIPVVKRIDRFRVESVEQLLDKVKDYMIWCKKHCREGVVIKSYNNQTFAKEKIIVPERKRVKPKNDEPLLPEMPYEKKLRCLEHAFDEIGEWKWEDKTVSMPIVAKHFQLECREHGYEMPRDIYPLWMNTLLADIKPKEDIKDDTT